MSLIQSRRFPFLPFAKPFFSYLSSLIQYILDFHFPLKQFFGILYSVLHWFMEYYLFTPAIWFRDSFRQSDSSLLISDVSGHIEIKTTQLPWHFGLLVDMGMWIIHRWTLNFFSFRPFRKVSAANADGVGVGLALYALLISCQLMVNFSNGLANIPCQSDKHSNKQTIYPTRCFIYLWECVSGT